MSDLLSNAFVNSVLDDEVLKIAADITELTLDSVINDGLLKDIPLVGTAISLYKIGNSFRDHQLIKKIYWFLYYLSDINDEERASFVKKINTEKERKQFIEQLLILLDRLDDLAKAKILTNAFKFYISETISRDGFLRISNLITDCHYSDLLGLSHQHGFHNEKRDNSLDNWQLFNNDVTQQNLVRLGILLVSYKFDKLSFDRSQENISHLDRVIQEKKELSTVGRALALIIDYRDADLLAIKKEYEYIFRRL